MKTPRVPKSLPTGPNLRTVLVSVPARHGRLLRWEAVDLYGCGHRCVDVFAEELAALTAPFREFVIKTFAAICPPEFWLMPASLSGKYHPSAFARPGGLVLHTRLVCWWVDRLLRCEGSEYLPDHARDIGIAAALLHDVAKHRPIHGAPGAGPAYYDNYTAMHGLWASEAIHGMCAGRRIPGVTAAAYFAILNAVCLHMGIWSARVARNTSYGIGSAYERNIVRIVIIADYAAAQQVPEQVGELAASTERGRPPPDDRGVPLWRAGVHTEAD